jgi:hypothetical protein
VNGGGWVVWGWWVAEKTVFDDDDDWGEERAERMEAIFGWLLDPEALREAEES